VSVAGVPAVGIRRVTLVLLAGGVRMGRVAFGPLRLLAVLLLGAMSAVSVASATPTPTAVTGVGAVTAMAAQVHREHADESEQQQQGPDIHVDLLRLPRID
jgi:hypothetical protein